MKRPKSESQCHLCLFRGGWQSVLKKMKYPKFYCWVHEDFVSLDSDYERNVIDCPKREKVSE